MAQLWRPTRLNTNPALSPTSSLVYRRWEEWEPMSWVRHCMGKAKTRYDPQLLYVQ